jgi:hypothetical protein
VIAANKKLFIPEFFMRLILDILYQYPANAKYATGQKKFAKIETMVANPEQINPRR